MTKTELIKKVASRTRLSQKQVKDVIDAFTHVVSASLRDGEKRVFLPDFGAFVLVSRKGKKGRNPRTGEEITIPERKSVIFRPALRLKKAVNP